MTEQAAEDLVTIQATHPSPDVELLRVSGELDMLTAPILADHVQRVLPTDTRRLVIDLSGVTFLGSSGLTTLLQVHRSLGDGQLALVCSTNALRALQATALDTLFTIHPTVQDALDAR
jgi:anti-anti-sigma factor